MEDVTKRDFRLDDDTLLSTWGFSSSCCAKCGIPNSELEGLLIQCGKCKMAYYCSMKCFNGDLMSHRKFCTTTPWDKNPVNKPVTPMVEPQSKPELPKKPRQKVSTTRTAPPPKKSEILSDDDSSVTSSSSSSSDSKESIDFVQEEETKDALADEAIAEESGGYPTEADPVAVVSDENDETEEEEEVSGKLGYVSVGEGQDDGGQGNERRNPRVIRGNPRVIPEPSEFKREVVNLKGIPGLDPRDYGWQKPEWANDGSYRELADYEPRHYDWLKPEWAVNSRLRKTLMGDIVKARGDINRAALLGSCAGELGGSMRSRHVPEWVLKSPLKKTPRSDVIKSGGKLEKPTTHIREFIERSSLNGSNDFSLDGSKNCSLSGSKDLSLAESFAEAPGP